MKTARRGSIASVAGLITFHLEIWNVNSRYDQITPCGFGLRVFFYKKLLKVVLVLSQFSRFESLDNLFLLLNNAGLKIGYFGKQAGE